MPPNRSLLKEMERARGLGAEKCSRVHQCSNAHFLPASFPLPQFLTSLSDELAGLGFSEAGHLINFVVATGVLKAAERHTFAVDNTVRKCFRESLLGFLQRM